MESASSLDEEEPVRSAMLWQESLARILDPSTPQGDRELLLRDLLNRGPEIAAEVSKALEDSDLESLVPPDSESRRLLEDINSVQDQVFEEVMAQANEAQVRLSDPERLASEVAQAAQDAQPVVEQAVGSAAAVFSSLLSDPAKAAALAQQEARNVVSRTPEGAEMPPYSVLVSGEGFEVRQYAPCSVVSVEIPTGGGSGAGLGSGLGPFGGGGALSGGALAAYNAIVSYFLGANADGVAMELTAPVRLDPPNGGARRLSLMLPSRYTCSSAPMPTAGGSAYSPKLRQMEEEVLAVYRFPGFATEGEVKRSLRKLESSILSSAAGEVEIVATDEQAVLLQYNPPYTLPWLRQNEVALPVRMMDAATTAAPPPPPPTAEVEEKQGEEEEEKEGVATDAAGAAEDEGDASGATEAGGAPVDVEVDVEEEVVEVDEDDSAPSDC